MGKQNEVNPIGPASDSIFTNYDVEKSIEVAKEEVKSDVDRSTDVINATVNEKVLIECYSGMGSGGPAIITKITKRYHETTGIAYRVYWVGDHGFHQKGHAITPPTAYYMTSLKPKE